MKLNPEELEIVSFPTDAQADVISRPIDTGYPTPQTYCFVCD
jgi:hypothetical protein